MSKYRIAIFPFLIFSVSCASSGDVQMKNKQALYDNCMNTFKDDVKCGEFLAKTESDFKTAEEKRKEQVASLSKEQLAGLKLRKEVKDTLPGKNNIYVKNFIGEPDDIIHYGERTYWVYTRPICKFSPDSDPDEKITVIFRKVLVERVEHIKPVSAVDEGAGFRKILDPSLETQPKKKMNGLDKE